MRNFYLSSAPIALVTDTNPTTESKPTASMEPMPYLNSDVHVLCTVIKNVMTPATEAKITVLFRNVQAILSLR